MSKKFLIIQTAFIGDVVLATPLIEALHRQFPEAKIDFMVRKGNEALLKEHPYLHELIIWDKTRKKHRNLLQLVQKIRKTKYDYAINLQRFGSTGMMTALSNAKNKIGFDKNPFSFSFTKKVKHKIGDHRHEVERNLELIEDLTGKQQMRPKLYPSESDYQQVKGYWEKPYICIAPASVWFTKQFPAEQWVEAIDKISGYNIYLIGSAQDKELCDAIQDKSTNNTINLCGKLSLLQSAALMEKASMNYVNDSAPLHLASAMNAPTAAIFCSTVPAFGFGPLAETAHTIERKGPLSCRPCGLHGYKACPEKHFKCARDIQTEQLLEVLP